MVRKQDGEVKRTVDLVDRSLLKVMSDGPSNIQSVDGSLSRFIFYHLSLRGRGFRIRNPTRWEGQRRSKFVCRTLVVHQVRV